MKTRTPKLNTVQRLTRIAKRSKVWKGLLPLSQIVVKEYCGVVHHVGRQYI